MSINNHHNKMVAKVIYAFKRQYGGGPVSLYKHAGSSTDIKTGVRTNLTTMVQVKRAVILPERVDHNVERSISLISADKQSVIGGWYNRGGRVFLIDRRDVPDLTLSTEDWLIYDGKKYEVKHFDDYEFDSVYVIAATRFLSNTSIETHCVYGDDVLCLGETDV